MRRLLVPHAKPNSALSIDGESFHYLSVVLRMKAGDELELFDGAGRSFPSKIESITADSLTIATGAEVLAAATRPITIVQGLPKGDRLEFILQKGTELGVSAFAPVVMARSIAKLDDEKAGAKVQRWVRIVEEAAKQCRRNDVPRIIAPTSIDTLIATELKGQFVILFDEEERAVPLRAVLHRLERADQPLAMIIGPEGGLERSEVERFIRAGAVAVSLGPQVLRTETAALAAVSIIRFSDGNLG